MHNKLKQIINEEIGKIFSLKEEKGDLLKLVGKPVDGDITPDEAKIIGHKIASMNGEDKKKHLSMVAALGGYYGGQNPEAKEHLTKLRNSILTAYKGAKKPVEEETTDFYKRYVVTVDFYIYAKNDAESKVIASNYIKQMDIDDNKISIVSIHEQPTGTMNSRLVYGKD